MYSLGIPSRLPALNVTTGPNRVSPAWTSPLNSRLTSSPTTQRDHRPLQVSQHVQKWSAAIPFRKCQLYCSTCSGQNFVVILGSSLSHPTANPWDSPAKFTLKVDMESDHVSPAGRVCVASLLKPANGSHLTQSKSSTLLGHRWSTPPPTILPCSQLYSEDLEKHVARRGAQ